MKIAVIGANGRVGSRVVAEAKSRQHEVTAIVRDAAKVADQDIKVIEKDIFELTTDDIKGFDVVVNAFGAPNDATHLYLDSGKHLAEIFKGLASPRLLIVGGASSLLVDDQGTVLLNTPEFPEAYRVTAEGMFKELEFLRTVEDVNWTFLSPAAEFAPGERTGKFRLGKDHLLVDQDGNSFISMEDYSIALVDEIEKPEHIKMRFTVAY